MLDTNIVTAALRRDAALDERMRGMTPGSWCISAVTRSELRYGVEKNPQATRLATIVQAFLAAAVAAPWDAAAADATGRVRALLKKQGTPIGVYDEMIAGHALALGAIVVTDNTKHFAQVPGLVLENWLRQPENDDGNQIGTR